MIDTLIKNTTPRLLAWRRDFHRHPEPAWTEFRTAALVAEHLLALSLPLRMGAEAVDAASRCQVPGADTLEAARRYALATGAPAALVARMGEGLTGLWAELDCRQEGDSDAPLLAVRVDMDALPLAESRADGHLPRREDFASCRDGHMHACGHDAHAALGMALAEVLCALRGRLRGRVRFIFQPAEEGTLGALPMLRAGAVDGVDYLLGLHMGLGLNTTGHMACTARNFLATTKLDAHFHGRKAHAGLAPQEGRNALLAACSATLNVHALPRHGQGDTRVGVGTLECRHPRNVVPDSARLELETRGASNELNAWMAQEARRILEQAAAQWDCTVRVEDAGAAPHVNGDLPLARQVRAAAQECGAFGLVEEARDLNASEDFSVLLQAVQAQGGQGAFVLMGSPCAGGHHTPTFDLDESALPLALELLTRTVLRLLGRE